MCLGNGSRIAKIDAFEGSANRSHIIHKSNCQVKSGPYKCNSNCQVKSGPYKCNTITNGIRLGSLFSFRYRVI